MIIYRVTSSDVDSGGGELRVHWSTTQSDDEDEGVPRCGTPIGRIMGTWMLDPVEVTDPSTILFYVNCLRCDRKLARELTAILSSENRLIPLVPIPVEFDEVPEDVYPLVGGGFHCMICNTSGDNWRTIPHCATLCSYASGYESKRTHGEAKDDFLKGRATCEYDKH